MTSKCDIIRCQQDSPRSRAIASLNGNILTLKRNGEDDDPNNVFTIDDLHYTYNNGNQLKKVSDATNHSAGYNDRHTSANVDDFEYDTFGNLIVNRDKDIQTLVYNHLNLPVKVTFGSGASRAYTYTANGAKIKKTATDAQSATTTTEYVDGFQYTDEVLDFFPHSEGYVKALPALVGGSGYQFRYVFNFTDHLGNIRLKYTEHPQTGETEILEENHYYPYGLTHQGYNGGHLVVGLEQPGTPITLIPVTPGVTDTYKYKFGGMEYSDEFDINTYDFGARNYDPALGRWMNIDPLAEFMYTHSPYNYVFNNPIYYIDPDGQMPLPQLGGNLGMSDMSMGFGGNEGLSSGGGGERDPQYPETSGIQEMAPVYLNNNNDNNEDSDEGRPTVWASGTQDLGEKDGRRIGEIDGTKLPGAVGTYRFNFKDLVRFILEGLGIYDKAPPKKPKANESTMETRNEEPVDPPKNNIVYTVEGQLKPDSRYGVNSPDYGGTGESSSTKDYNKAKRDSLRFVQTGLFKDLSIRRDTINNK